MPWGKIRSIFVPVPLPSATSNTATAPRTHCTASFRSNICFCTGNTLVIRGRKGVGGGNWSLAITSQMPHISTLAVSTEKFEKKEKVWCKNIKRNNARYLGSSLALRIPVKTKEGLLKSLYNWFHPEVTQGNHLPHQKRTLKPCVKSACFCAVAIALESLQSFFF